MKNLKPLHELYKLWGQLGDIPTDEESNTDAPFLDFPTGTPVQDIWHWFERQNSDFIVGDVLAGIRRVTDEDLMAAKSEMEKSLPNFQGYEKGFKDGVHSILSALRKHIQPQQATAALKEVVDAYQKDLNVHRFAITVDLTVSADGDVVDEAWATLRPKQVSEIVDKSAKLVFDYLEGLPLEQRFAALHEELSAGNIIQGRPF